MEFTFMAATVAVAALAALTAGAADSVSPLRWTELPPIPDREGFASPFAGVSGGALIVAGGANIPGDKWADTFEKVWYDSVFLLEKPDGSWRNVSKLPRPLGYGVSISYHDSLICIGGSDMARHYADVFRMTWKDSALEFAPLPRLPSPCANACGVLMGDTIYVAGGIASPTATAALKTFWKLDLSEKTPHWIELEPWPGPARMLAVAGTHRGSFYLFSGASLKAGPNGKPQREYLHDAYRFTPGQGWARLADLPRAAVAAPSPAPAIDDRLLILTGDDGTKVDFAPLSQHPGFPKEILAFDIAKNTWSIAGPTPFSRGTVPVVNWGSRIVVPNGEVRPRERTPEVWSAEVRRGN